MEQYDTSAASALVGHHAQEPRGAAELHADGSLDCSSLPRSLANLVNIVRSPATVDQVIGLLTPMALEFGFDGFSYISLAGSGREENRRLLRYISNQPDDWIAFYKRERLQRRDPVVACARTTTRAFAWDLTDPDRRSSLHQERVCALFEQAGLCCGITVPVHGPDTVLTLLTLFCRKARNDLSRLLPDLGFLLLLVTICIGSWIEGRHAYERPEQHPALSEREKECLLWTARGKTSWEIAKIIGRSEDTVNFHLKKAISKLNASNKCHAVSKALTQGQLLI